MVFGSRIKDALLLIFFTTIGLSAKLAALKSGGKPLVILCLVTVVALVVQNISGAALAAWGAHPAYGVLVGSLSFVGGPGTAMAWAKELQAQGLQNAPVVAVGSATLAVIVGALVAGPVTGWIVARHKLHAQEGGPTDVTFAPHRRKSPIRTKNRTRSKACF